MILAVEDPLSEAIARRLLLVLRPELIPTAVLGLGGRDSVRVRCRELNRSAAHLPVLVLTDQDVPDRCPPTLLIEWLGTARPNLIFRVAVMEVESWVMAHRDAFAAFISVPCNRVPANTDALPDPKQTLVNLARRSRRRDIRADLVPAAGSTAQVGPAYNPRLREFVESTWDPVAAADTSASLRRAVERLRDYRAPATNRIG